uniref:Uncharacterized protein n=1 Tax=Trypanosoma vivax (strain Y486) TaxID=1055687 RepID=G0U097_TRYVY|nr:hypothetical protein, unlikely [Trypanosoma vivax Y486]
MGYWHSYNLLPQHPTLSYPSPERAALSLTFPNSLPLTNTPKQIVRALNTASSTRSNNLRKSSRLSHSQQQAKKHPLGNVYRHVTHFPSLWVNTPPQLPLPPFSTAVFMPCYTSCAPIIQSFLYPLPRHRFQNVGLAKRKRKKQKQVHS